ncbi:putative phage-related membrane protein [Cupriavidus necator]|uniref:Putative phage-related membrane protein n=1 Tax=Cupriavidus necator TaxID=106590 RepID=A0A1K0JDU2_CUPNE|nr:putative phage-related membrane protein [Cupriavidus necator]
MAVWLMFGLAFYAAVLLIDGNRFPTVQVTFQKLGHVTTFAWVGYWISRNALGRISATSPTNDRISRAIVIGCVIIAGLTGL